VFWIQLLVRTNGVWVCLHAAAYSAGATGHDRFGFTLHLIIDNLNLSRMHSSAPEIADHPDGASDPDGVV
jgi:hypothetical protein